MKIEVSNHGMSSNDSSYAVSYLADLLESNGWEKGDDDGTYEIKNNGVRYVVWWYLCTVGMAFTLFEKGRGHVDKSKEKITYGLATDGMTEKQNRGVANRFFNEISSVEEIRATVRATKIRKLRNLYVKNII